MAAESRSGMSLPEFTRRGEELPPESNSWMEHSVPSFENLSNTQVKAFFGALVGALAATLLYVIIASQLDGTYSTDVHPSSHTGCTVTYDLHIGNWWRVYAAGSLSQTGIPLEISLYKDGSLSDSGSTDSSSGRLFYICPLRGNTYSLTLTSSEFCTGDSPVVELVSLDESSGVLLVVANSIMGVTLLGLTVVCMWRTWQQWHTKLPDVSILFLFVPVIKICAAAADFIYLPAGNLLSSAVYLAVLFMVYETWRFMIHSSAQRALEYVDQPQILFAEWIQNMGFPRYPARLYFMMIGLLLFSDDIVWFSATAYYHSMGPVQLALWDEYNVPTWAVAPIVVFKLSVALGVFVWLDRVLKSVVCTSPYSLVHRQVNMRRFMITYSGLAVFGYILSSFATAGLFSAKEESLDHWSGEVSAILAIYPGGGSTVVSIWEALWIVCMGFALSPAPQREARRRLSSAQLRESETIRRSCTPEDVFVQASPDCAVLHQNVANIDLVRIQNSLADWSYRGLPPLYPPERDEELVIGSKMYPSYPDWEQDLEGYLGRITLYKEIDGDHDTHVKVFVETAEGHLNEKVVHIAFKGTSTRANWKTDFDTAQRPYTIPERVQKRAHESWCGLEEVSELTQDGECLVHKGFVKVYRLVKQEMLEAVTELASQTCKICVCGHSLGGGLATLASMDLMEAFPQVPLALTTFGSPRVGDHTFSAFLDAALDESWRVVADNDPVPHTPKAGCFAGCSADYKHVQTMVRVTNFGHIIIAPAWVEQYLLDVRSLWGLCSPGAHDTAHYARCLVTGKKLESQLKAVPLDASRMTVRFTSELGSSTEGEAHAAEGEMHGEMHDEIVAEVTSGSHGVLRTSAEDGNVCRV